MKLAREQFVHLGADDDLPTGSQVTIDGGRLRTKEDLLRALANALGFPDYFGNNWDAFEECLRDVNRSAEGTPGVVQIDGSERVRARLPRDVAVLQEIWADVGQDEVTPHLVLA